MTNPYRKMALAPALALLLTGCELEGFVDGNRFTEDIHKTYPLASGGRLTVESFNGSVEIQGWERDEVDMSATKHASREELLQEISIDVTPSNGALLIRAKRPPMTGLRGNAGVRFRLRVPHKTRLERIDTSNGPVRVELVEGDADVRTSNGPVRFREHAGNVEVHTSNGPVEMDRMKGNATIQTSNGPVTVSGARGHLDVKTSNGPIDADLSELDTTQGVRLSTSNGPLSLRMPANASARLKATTSNGQIRCDLPMTNTVEQSKTHLEGTVGNGGPFVVLSTSNGGVRISSR